MPSKETNTAPPLLAVFVHFILQEPTSSVQAEVVLHDVGPKYLICVMLQQDSLLAQLLVFVFGQFTPNWTFTTFYKDLTFNQWLFDLSANQFCIIILKLLQLCQSRFEICEF
ncbi:Hypothetical_protein [Hexamita inflata]|uniref:Hypothetical_protein n=1 Tax=Hexamita inflata TaxID=28002 RepID=A0AA86QD78_9EUKA|nr:Hypothetical protein HINF_LOCUS38529 [Hexamita inflata]